MEETQRRQILLKLDMNKEEIRDNKEERAREDSKISKLEETRT